MTSRTTGTSPLAIARLAGALALVTLVFGSFAGIVHARLVVPGDAVATVENITASETLFRLGFVSGLAMYAVFVAYVLVLYRLLAPVDRSVARFMVAFALIGVPIAMLNQINQSAVLLLLGGADHLEALAPDQIRALVMFFLDLHKHGALVGVLFWGLWLLPLGWLVFRSGFFPRILGVLLVIGCFGWLIVFFQRFLLPEHEALASSRYAAHVAELSWMAWLLVKGVDVERWEARASESG